jgi:hypothetical protein
VCSPGNANPRNRARIATTAEGRDVPGRPTATDVDAADERIVVEALRFALLRFLDALAVDELKLVGGGRQPADTNADEVAVDAVGLDPLRQQFLIGQRAVPRVDRLVYPAVLIAAEAHAVELAGASGRIPVQEDKRMAVGEAAFGHLENLVRHRACLIEDVEARGAPEYGRP